MDFKIINCLKNTLQGTSEMSDVLKKLAFVAKKKKFCSRRQKDLGVK
jgi:hypothetical protein